MAYYPAQDMIVLKAKTEEEMDNEIKAKMAEGYFPVSDTVVYKGKLSGEPVAYKQSMVKRENTDPQFIMSMFAAFSGVLTDIRDQLSAINTALNATNMHLQAIEDNTAKDITTKDNTAE